MLENKSKICLINQPAGLGDIIWCQKIAWHYYELGYQIHWPINDIYLNDVKKHINNPWNFQINTNNFPSHNIISDDFVYLKLDGCQQYFNYPYTMEAKYKVVNIDHTDYQTYVNLNRDFDKENELYNLLGLKDGDEYVLANYNYGTPPDMYRMYAPIKNKNLNIVEMKVYENYNIFDWCKVVENATELCITESALTILAELLNLNAKVLTAIYRRPDLNQINGLYKLNWNFIIG
tara:strand:+ start:4771 stop:5472 length:702 start_codon:yes stop_codon:yes gene_type:complete